MNEKTSLSTDYKDWLNGIKTNIRSSQIKASLSVNSALIALYWDLGRQIFEKQEQLHWGSSVIEQLSLDLRKEFPDMGDFSTRNLFYIRQFSLFYRDASVKVSQLVGQIEKVNQLGAQIP